MAENNYELEMVSVITHEDSQEKFSMKLTSQEKLERVIYRQLMVEKEAKRLARAFEEAFSADTECLHEFNDAFASHCGDGYLSETNLELDERVIENRTLRRAAKALRERREWYLSDLTLYFDDEHRRNSKTLLNGAMIAGGVLLFGLTASFYFPPAFMVGLVLSVIVMAVAAWMKFHGGTPDTSLEQYGVTPKQYEAAEKVVVSRINPKPPINPTPPTVENTASVDDEEEKEEESKDDELASVVQRVNPDEHDDRPQPNRRGFLGSLFGSSGSAPDDGLSDSDTEDRDYQHQWW